MPGSVEVWLIVSSREAASARCRGLFGSVDALRGPVSEGTRGEAE